jgi:putative solute:sodium symporter small subunit
MSDGRVYPCQPILDGYHLQKEAAAMTPPLSILLRKGGPMSNAFEPLDQSLGRDPRAEACISRYWRRNVSLMAVLLVIWAAASLGCGVLFADSLNAVRLGGFPLGFWFAQQGSILIFVILILTYALAMRRLDRHHHAELTALRDDSPGEVAGPR